MGDQKADNAVVEKTSRSFFCLSFYDSNNSKTLIDLICRVQPKQIQT